MGTEGTGQWLAVILLGMVAGAVGQLVRAISGLARLNRERLAGENSVSNFQASTLVVSLIVGATAGAIAAVALSENLMAATTFPTESILGLMAAGYAGADFIEGFAGKHLAGASSAHHLQLAGLDTQATPAVRESQLVRQPGPDGAVG